MFLVNFHKNHRKSLCFIAKMSRRLRKHAKLIVFFDFSNHPKAQVPIFSVQKSIFAHIPGSRGSPGSPGSPGNGARTATSDHPNNAPGVKMTEVLTNSLKLRDLQISLRPHCPKGEEKSRKFEAPRKINQ